MVSTPIALATADAAGLAAAAVLLVYLVYAIARAERF